MKRNDAEEEPERLEPAEEEPAEAARGLVHSHSCRSVTSGVRLGILQPDRPEAAVEVGQEDRPLVGLRAPR